MAQAESRNPEDLARAIERLAAADQLLVAMDFDGVMAPLVAHPADARALPASAAALAELASLPRTTTALVSGRALASLRTVADPDERTLLVGSHGAEVWAGPDHERLALDPARAQLLADATQIMDDVVVRFPGTVIETKPAGVVLHTRNAAPDAAAAATADALGQLMELDRGTQGPGLHLSDGKAVLECSVVDANKGEALALLRELSGATAVLFAGDDVTDEDAFAVLGPADAGIKVGPGTSRAEYRIADPQALPAVLQDILAARRSAIG